MPNIKGLLLPWEMWAHVDAMEGPRQFNENIEHLWKHTDVQAMKGRQQDPERHPEGDVWQHTELVYKLVEGLSWAKDKERYVLLCASILHDVGKPVVRKETNGELSFHEHHIVGAKMVRNIMLCVNEEHEPIIDDVIWLVRNHMTPQIADVSNKKLRKLANHPYWSHLIVLAIADALSCGAQEALKRISNNRVRAVNLRIR